MSKQPPTRTYCKRSRPLPYCNPIVGRPGAGSLPSTIAPPDHPNERTYVLTYIRTGQTLYPLHNFVVRGDNSSAKRYNFHTNHIQNYEVA